MIFYLTLILVTVVTCVLGFRFNIKWLQAVGVAMVCFIAMIDDFDM